jgi:hypothetical protein
MRGEVAAANHPGRSRPFLRGGAKAPVSKSSASPSIDPFYAADLRALDTPRPCCSCCGVMLDPLDAAVVKRGALTIERETFTVLWRSKPVPLSPTETNVLAWIAARGHASFPSIATLLGDLGLSARTRDVLLHRIRKKFAAIGAPAPFIRCGHAGIRLVVEPDENGSSETVIGLRGATTRFVMAGSGLPAAAASAPQP